MALATDTRPLSAALYYLPVKTRMPLKFGAEVTTEVTCARVCMEIQGRDGREATGWGETPLSVHWVWPSALSYDERHRALRQFTERLAKRWARFESTGHPLEVGHDFLSGPLLDEQKDFNQTVRAGKEPLPHLAALVCNSPFDIALHDAFGMLHGLPTYETYGHAFLNRDLSAYLEPAEGADFSFNGLYPEDFLLYPRPDSLVAWHLVGGKDPLEPSDLTGGEPDDGEPVLLRDWIQRDGLTCLKVKLRGDDAQADYDRLIAVGRIARDEAAHWLSVDFNCTVSDPAYVNEVLDRLKWEYPRLYGMILYVEQPFPYDLESHRINVYGVAARKPLFMDESAHDWHLVRLGRSLGWNGVALKTCKTQTGALLSLCWAKAHDMGLMVQDLTNPMLAQIPHVLLAAHAGTIMGVETNSMQYYPAASAIEAVVHPGLYQRRGGDVSLATIQGSGFGYRLSEIDRTLPPPVCVSQG